MNLLLILFTTFFILCTPIYLAMAINDFIDWLYEDKTDKSTKDSR